MARNNNNRLEGLPLELKYQIVESLHLLVDFTNLQKASEIFSNAVAPYKNRLGAKVRQNSRLYHMKRRVTKESRTQNLPLDIAITLIYLMEYFEQNRIMSLEDFLHFPEQISAKMKNSSISDLSIEQMQRLLENNKAVYFLTDSFFHHWIYSCPHSFPNLNSSMKPRKVFKNQPAWKAVISAFYKSWILLTLIKFCGKVFEKEESRDINMLLKLATDCVPNLIKINDEREEIQVVLNVFIEHIVQANERDWGETWEETERDFETQKLHWEVNLFLFHSNFWQFYHVWAKGLFEGPDYPFEFDIATEEHNKIAEEKRANGSIDDFAMFKLSTKDHVLKLLDMVIIQEPTTVSPNQGASLIRWLGALCRRI